MERINKRKLLNTILFFSHSVNYLGKIKLYKLLYFLDFEHFKLTARSVTGLDYFAWDRGPVHKTLFDDLDKNHIPEDYKGYLKIMIRERLHQILPLKKINMSVFTNREKDLLEKLVYFYKDTKAEDMKEISHLPGQPWDRTKKKKGLYQYIDYLLALDNTPESISEEEAIEKQARLEETFRLINQE